MAELIGQEQDHIETGLTAHVTEQTGVCEDNENEGINDRKVATFDFEENSPKTDFVLIVEGTKLHVAKLVLTLASPVFDRMFLSEFKENTCKELELPNKNLDDFKEFLRCIYPNTLTPVSDKNALSILPLVDEYQVTHLKIRCEMVLLDRVQSETPANELFQLLREACLYDLRDLRERCVTLAAIKTREELDAANDNCPLPAEPLVDIFRLLNTRLEAKIKELETPNKGVSERSEIEANLRQCVSEVEERITLFKDYLSADMKTSKDLEFNGHLNWKETHLILAMDVVGNCKTATDVVVWGVPLRVSISIADRHKYGDRLTMKTFPWLCVGIKNSGQNTIYCKFQLQYILVSRQPTGETIKVCRDGVFKAGRQYMIEDIKKMSEIKDVMHGFVRDGKIGLIIQIYMSEPNV